MLNPYLNLFFTNATPRDALEPIVREFSYSRVAWRRPLQRAYVYCGLNRLTSAWLSTAYLRVTPRIPELESWIIVPGNNRIRFLDRCEGHSYSVLKDQFPTRSLRQEIDIQRRAQHLQLSVPKVLIDGADKNWFCEQYVCGTPTNRLRDSNHARQAIRSATSDLDRLARESIQTRSIAEYATSLADRIAQYMTRWSIPDRSILDSIQQVLPRLVERVRSSYGSSTLRVSPCHGDFQDANILVNDNAVWLIDWEFTGTRQVLYDRLVYDLQLRFPAGLYERVIKIVDNGYSESMLLADVTDDERNLLTTAAGRKQVILLLLLEELELRLDQTVDRPYHVPPAGLWDITDVAQRMIDG